MDGTISLGIYDQAGKIVRVLHQNAQLNDFAIGADALVTRWDGKDDGNQDSAFWTISRARLRGRSTKTRRSGRDFAAFNSNRSERGESPTGPQSFAER